MKEMGSLLLIGGPRGKFVGKLPHEFYSEIK